MEKFLALGSGVAVSVFLFLAMFITHVLLLTKAMQCSYDQRILLPSSNFNLPDNVPDADKEMISRMTSCRYGTFLEEDKFVVVDFTSDCITVTRSDGRVLTSGSDCAGQAVLNKPTVTFRDNKTVFLDLLSSEDGIFFSKDGLYICF